MSNKPKPTDKILPKPVRFITRGFVYRQFTFKEKLKLLLGYRVLLEIHVASEHNPGQTQPVTHFHLTPMKTQASAMIELRKEVEKQQAKRGVQPNTLPEKK